MAPRRKCMVCGSQQWRKEPATGLVVCSEGHILQNYRNETNETQELGPHQLHRRTIKSGRKARERESKADPELYHGARARYLYLQCLQLLLRKQAAALIRAWQLPPEFEIICRDLWALHLNLLPFLPPPEPLLHQQAVNSHSPSKPEEIKKSARASTVTDDEKEEDLPENITPDSSGTDSSEEVDELQDDPEMDELLRILSESSSSEEENERSGQPRPKPEGGKRNVNMFVHNGPASNIALLMVACWMLRLPITYMDLVRLIEGYKLPYLEPLRHLPGSMARHLTKHTVQALSPPHAPRPQVLHGLSARLARKLRTVHKVRTPELNAAPMLWRVVRALGGTPVLYDLSKTVAHVLSLPLTLHHSLAPRLAHLEIDDPDSHKYDDVPPELALLATAIIVLKMAYGLDGKARVPKTAIDPACALPRMKEYLTLIQEMKEAHANSKKVLFSASSEMSALDLDDGMLAEYLDLCERALLGQELLRPDQRVLDEYFPLSPGRGELESCGETEEEWAEAGQRGLAAGVPVEGRAETHEPGQAYAIYRTRDVLGSLPDEYEMVIGHGAGWVGVEAEMVLSVVERYERRLSGWWERVRREEGTEVRRRVEKGAAA
ncbi:hypothetical protein BC834DRAFT_952535 [Gloeopeniophorella convolvens]|nr:hypothetical protein BC834DRAFT_952535 [Gloeopeniophorella convolvens]